MTNPVATDVDTAILTLDPASADTVLYQGKATEQDSGLECELTVTARWGFKHDVRWVATFDEDIIAIFNGREYSFLLQAGYGDQRLVEHAQLRDWDLRSMSGWLSSGQAVGQTVRPVESVQLRWVNLSDVGSDEPLQIPSQSGAGYRMWRGRLKLPLDDWEMTLDQRPDLSKVLAGLKENGGHAVTHLATLRRRDGQAFTADDLNGVLRAYHLAVAFALGRESSPSLAVATDADGILLWREWSVRRADQMGGVTPWWHSNAVPLGDVTRLFGPLLLGNQWSENAALVLQGYLASKLNKFVEDRVSSGFSAMERLAYQRLVLDGRISKTQYRKIDASQLIETLLTMAKVPLDVPDHLPVLKKFAQDEAGSGNVELNGPTAMARVRNRFTHPKDPKDLYGTPGLVYQALLLLHRYLELLILNWVGYKGSLQDTSIMMGWSGNVQPVPWA